MRLQPRYVLFLFILLALFTISEAQAQPAWVKAQLEKEGKTGENGSGEKSKRKMPGGRFASMFGFGPISNWDNKIKPSATFKWSKGYRFSVGPKINWRKHLGKENALRASVSYLPLMFKDIGSDNKIGFTNFDISYIKYPNPRFYYTVGYDYSMFKANNQMESLVQSRGGNISNEKLNGFSVGVGHQVMKIPISIDGMKIPIPIFLRVTYRWGEKYEFGTNFGDAGSDFDQRRGFSVTLWPLLRRF